MLLRVELLKRYIVVYGRHPAALTIITASRVLRSQPRSTAPTQESDSLRDNLGDVTFVAALIVIVAGSNTAFDENLPTLGQVLPTGFTLFSPDNNIMPLGSLLPIALRIGPHFGCRNWKARHGPPGGGKTHLRIFPQIADQDCFVYRHQSLPALTNRQKEQGYIIAGIFLSQQRIPWTELLTEPWDLSLMRSVTDDELRILPTQVRSIAFWPAVH
jgi:hypothetical protein